MVTIQKKVSSAIIGIGLLNKDFIGHYQDFPRQLNHRDGVI